MRHMDQVLKPGRRIKNEDIGSLVLHLTYTEHLYASCDEIASLPPCTSASLQPNTARGTSRWQWTDSLSTPRPWHDITTYHQVLHLPAIPSDGSGWIMEK
ncbi:hypothetical protein ACOMHN_024562 [Nucella lapillus]